MKTTVIVFFALVTALCMTQFFSEVSFAAPPDNYTAKMMVRGTVMPMARMGTKTRVEHAAQGLVTVTLQDAKKVIMMSTANQAYLEQPLQDQRPSIQDPNTVVEKKKIGSETIDGHPCTKYDAVYYFKDKPAEKYKATIWEANDLGGLVIKTEMAMPEGKGGGGPIVTELKEVKVNAANASMFEVPANYKKVNTMMELMGGMDKMKDMMKQKKK